MNNISRILNRLKGLTKAIVRYPLTEAYLVVVAVIIAVAINTTFDREREVIALLVGAILTAALQRTYERFFTKELYRYGLMAVGALATFGYYLVLQQATEISTEIMVRTLVAMFAMLIAFIWVPSIKQKNDFNDSFMAVFKAFFQTALYSGVIFGGASLIIFAIDYLIVNVSERAYAHSANIVFVIFAPLFFLSLVPVFLGERHNNLDGQELAQVEEKITKAAYIPRFLEILISYIIVPIASIYTVILALYILLNVTGNFWSNNLLEPLLVSYAIAVILVYILSSNIDNKFANLFRLIFPKVLVPVVLFQILASFLSLGDLGIVHTKYYVLLFGIFAACSGVVMSIFKPRRNGIIAALLIVFALVSIVPPVDAFTVSRNSQINLLETTLESNNMLENDTIVANPDVATLDMQKISSAMSYLDRMGYLDRVAFVPDNFRLYSDFLDTFGFNMYYGPEYPGGEQDFFYANRDPSKPIDISDYDQFGSLSFYNWYGYDNSVRFVNGTMTYNFELNNAQTALVFQDDDDNAIVTIDFEALLSQIESLPQGMLEDDAYFDYQSDEVAIRLYLINAEFNYYNNQRDFFMDFFALVKFN